MKILIVVDKQDSAIDRLSQLIKKNLDYLSIRVLSVHPKRYSEESLRIFEREAKQADLIHFQYWKTAMMLMGKFEWLKEKPSLLTHHNPYNLHEHDWKEFTSVVVKNETQQKELNDSILVKHCVDLDFFEFNVDYTEEKVVGMVASRIEGKKGVKEVAQACKELGYKFLLIGRISKLKYFEEIKEIAGDNFEFRENVTNEELKNAYKEMAIHVCNSIDNFESGTLPILESMASGVPVLTRYVGLVPDIYNTVNMIVRSGSSDNLEDLKIELKLLMEDREKRLSMSKKGWESVKTYSDVRMAHQYSKIYNDVLYPVDSLVSIITATYNRQEKIVQIIESLKDRTYKNIEYIVCDDNSDDGTESAVKSMRSHVDFPIKYVNTNMEGYNLATARNLGVIEAEGDFIMILDSRFKPELDAIDIFVKNIGKEKIWLFGEKGYNKNIFIENFSMIRRNYLVNEGMFNEGINEYGGMSQEIRERFSRAKYSFQYVPEARAKEILSSHSSSEKRKSIVKMKNLLYKLYE